jgi:hypothetical protein
MMRRNISALQAIHLSTIVAIAVLLSGCATSAPKKLGSNRVAAVLIKGASKETIKSSVDAVFTKHGFEPGGEDDKDLVFEKKATAMNAFVYGDWASGAVWARVKLFLTPRTPDETLLDCDIYMVQEPDDPLFTKERKVSARKSELQDLLEEVKKDAEAHRKP